jgi:hypothetical protein
MGKLSKLVDAVETASKKLDGLAKKDTKKLFRGLERPYDQNFNLSKSDAPSGYSTWTDNPDLARQYAGENGFVYEIDVPLSKQGTELVDESGERALFVDNQKAAGLNDISGREYLLYQDHEDFAPNMIRLSDRGGLLGNSDNAFRPVDEADIAGVKTGRPVSLNYTHNPSSAADNFGPVSAGDQFGRDLEPAGKYISPSSQSRAGALEGTEGGLAEFKNPLVVDNNNLKWKKELSDAYGGKTGVELSDAIKADGYDGIITIDRAGRVPFMTETVDLRDGVYKPLKSVAMSAPILGTGLLTVGGENASASTPRQGPAVGQRAEAPVNPVMHSAAGMVGKVNRRLDNRGLGLLSFDGLEDYLWKAAYSPEDINYGDRVKASLDVAP